MAGREVGRWRERQGGEGDGESARQAWRERLMEGRTWGREGDVGGGEEVAGERDRKREGGGRHEAGEAGKGKEEGREGEREIALLALKLLSCQNRMPYPHELI